MSISPAHPPAGSTARSQVAVPVLAHLALYALAGVAAWRDGSAVLVLLPVLSIGLALAAAAAMLVLPHRRAFAARLAATTGVAVVVEVAVTVALVAAYSHGHPGWDLS